VVSYHDVCLTMMSMSVVSYHDVYERGVLP
jgi:hypothetical protein